MQTGIASVPKMLPQYNRIQDRYLILNPVVFGEHFRNACDSSLHRCCWGGIGQSRAVVSRRGFDIAYMDLPHDVLGRIHLR